MKSYGLVLSGGGRNGAFAAGCINVLVKEFGIDFKIISGTSTGALQAPLVATGDIDKIDYLYRNVVDKDVLDERNFISAWFKGALNSSKPLKRLIDKYLDLKRLKFIYPHRKAIVNAVNLRTGLLERCDNSPENINKFKKFTLASASVPFMMPPVKIGRDYYVDGGLVDVTPIGTILNDETVKINKLIVITNSPLKPEVTDSSKPGLFEILKRTIDIVSAEIVKNDFYNNRGADIFTISPDKHYGDFLKFDPHVMNKIWLDGFKKTLAMENLIVR